jgi:hypothetical protein
VCDLGRGRWPWGDNSVDAAVASHILEHLPGESFFHFMRELYRVCKPGAAVELRLPWPRHDLYLNDPTHARPVLPATIIMFSLKYIDILEKEGKFLTSFAARNNVDFELDPKVRYYFDPSVDTKDPELDWKMKHLHNVVMEWGGIMRAIK